MNKFRKSLLSSIVVSLIVVLLLASLTGCKRDKDFPEGNLIIGVSNNSENSIVPLPSPEPSAIIDEQNSDNSPTEIEDVSAMIIKVENTDVFFNDKKVNYDRADINTLRSTLEERLLSLPDETQIKVDFNYGDNDICTIIEELLADLGLSYSLVPD